MRNRRLTDLERCIKRRQFGYGVFSFNIGISSTIAFIMANIVLDNNWPANTVYQKAFDQMIPGALYMLCVWAFTSEWDVLGWIGGYGLTAYDITIIVAPGHFGMCFSWIQHVCGHTPWEQTQHKVVVAILIAHTVIIAVSTAWYMRYCFKTTGSVVPTLMLKKWGSRRRPSPTQLARIRAIAGTAV